MITCTYIYTTVSKCSVYYCVIEVKLYFSFGIPIKQDFDVRLALAEQSANNVPIWNWHNLLKCQSKLYNFHQRRYNDIGPALI